MSALYLIIDAIGVSWVLLHAVFVAQEGNFF